jgi:hypothetical protein
MGKSDDPAPAAAGALSRLLARFYRPLWLHTPTHPNHRSQRLSDKPVKIAAKLTSEGVHRE